jgi:predicted DCC family thiol-disulfide oxidoreductase YuxK
MTDATLVYDDDCGFCTWWAEFLDERSEIPIVGFSELTPELRERLPENYEDCSHLVADERVYSCGESIEEAFARADVGPDLRDPVDFLRSFEDYGQIRERVYRVVANNRDKAGQVLSKTPPARRNSDDESADEA